MDNHTINLDDKARYQYYKDLGYHVPYNEPSDYGTYYAESLWIMILDCTLKTILGTMWIALVYSSVGGCYWLYKVAKNQLLYDSIKEKHEQEIKLYQDKQLIKDIKFQYERKIRGLDDRMERFELRGIHALWKYAAMLIIMVLVSAFWMTLEYMRYSLFYGSIFVVICTIIGFVNRFIYSPLVYKIKLYFEIKRLNKLIALDLLQQKKQD